jgi:hypothetical protein
MREKPAGEAELVEAVHAWGDRKRAFSQEQIGLASRVLGTKGWTTNPG